MVVQVLLVRLGPVFGHRGRDQYRQASVARRWPTALQECGLDSDCQCFNPGFEDGAHRRRQTPEEAEKCDPCGETRRAARFDNKGPGAFF